MHFEVLVEDSSGELLLQVLTPRLLGPNGAAHTWRLHRYKGVGRLPRGLKPNSDSSKRILLDQLPRLLSGFAKTPWVDKIVVVLDVDRRPCAEFLSELRNAAQGCGAGAKTLFRLAIEEIEAWYLGDREAILAAYPRAKLYVLGKYAQDSVCGTWELLADAIHPTGSVGLRKVGWTAIGQAKHEWASKIGPLMSLNDNASPSFKKFRDSLTALASEGDWAE